MVECRSVEVAELGDGEGLGRQREPEVRVGELRPQAIATGEGYRPVVEGQGRKLIDRVPARVGRHLRVEVDGDETEVRGRELPFDWVPVQVGSRLELLQVGQLAHVHLGRQMATDRLLERLTRLEIAAGKGPRSLPRLLRPLPEQDLKQARAHLQDDGERDLRGAARLA